MFRREDVLESVGVLRQKCVGLFRNVSGVIVQYDSDGAFRRILRIEIGQQANEFDAAVAVFYARLPSLLNSHAIAGPRLTAKKCWTYMRFSNSCLWK